MHGRPPKHATFRSLSAGQFKTAPVGGAASAVKADASAPINVEQFALSFEKQTVSQVDTSNLASKGDLKQ